MRPHGTFTWPAPVRGWITSSNFAQSPLDSAARLDNFFPTAQGAELRRGYRKHATLGAQAVRFMTYSAGSTNLFYAATANDIFEVSNPADADVAPVAELTGLAGGDWSSIQFGTAGGNFMLAVNGVDHATYGNGTALIPLVDETVIALAYDALSAAFEVGETVTGGTSGASAEILGIAPATATTGTLYIGAVTSGPFSDNETITDGATGSATSNIPSGVTNALTTTITNVATNALSHVWMNKARVFFIEKDSMSAWYLPADSIGGAASEINLGTVFAEGGNLLFGASWSVDSGSGMDDKCVFVTDRGEIAVYAGTDPSSASTWALEGVYKIGQPLNKHATFSLGGDLMILTSDGIYPLSMAVSRDYSATVAGSFSAPIEDDWQRVIARGTITQPITVTHWRSQGKLIISTPDRVDAQPVSFVANSRTGAWCRYIGWDIRASAVFSDQLYFADVDGFVHAAEIGGTDNNMAYTAYFVTAFSDMGAATVKTANRVNLIAQSSVGINYGVRIFKDQSLSAIPVPKNLPDPPGTSTWGVAEWGAGVWGVSNVITGRQKWKAAGGKGLYLAPAISVSSNSIAAPDFEIVSVQVRYEAGSVL